MSGTGPPGIKAGGPVIYRDTSLGDAELEALQSVFDEAPALTLSEAAAEACRRFEWHSPDGRMPIASCSIFLRRLEKHGRLRLPARRAPSGRRHQSRDLEEFLSFLGPIPGMVECQPTGELTVRPVAAEERLGFRLHLNRYHYLGFIKPAGESLCYVAQLGHELVALLVWGAAVLHNGPRDSYVGWDSRTRARKLPWVVNNRRFLVLPWIRQPHLASRVLAANLRRLSRDWEAAYGHSVFLAETFVDTARFKGTCYRASNWLHLGQTQGFSRTRDGFVPNHRPKASFVYPLHPRAVERLKEACPEPAEGSKGGSPCARR